MRVPGYTAYLQPDPQPQGMDVTAPGGVTGWSDAHNTIVWYGTLNAPGQLNLTVSLILPKAAQSQLRLTVAGQSHMAQAVGNGTSPMTVDFGAVKIHKTGTYRFVLQGISKSGATFGDVDALILDGPAVQDAHFSQAKSRAAPYVYMFYQDPPKTQVAWLYNEVTVKQDPLWSYFEACGFSRGYFGIQVNSPTERRIIFSVWNAGNEPTDPNKVPMDDRVQLLGKGPGVVTRAFGNEGTGGHSQLVYPWKTGQTYRFLVSAQPDGTGTIYSGYFYFPEKKQWGLIASFRAPKDGGWMNGLYSFNEDFNGANGYQKRFAMYGPTWIKTADGKWIEMTTVHFGTMADGTKERLDRTVGVKDGRFFLTNGGFEIPLPTVKAGASFTRPATGKPPTNIILPPIAAYLPKSPG